MFQLDEGNVTNYMAEQQTKVIGRYLYFINPIQVCHHKAAEDKNISRWINVLRNNTTVQAKTIETYLNAIAIYSDFLQFSNIVVSAEKCARIKKRPYPSQLKNEGHI